jgi:hypothetical protein
MSSGIVAALVTSPWSAAFRAATVVEFGVFDLKRDRKYFTMFMVEVLTD